MSKLPGSPHRTVLVALCRIGQGFDALSKCSLRGILTCTEACTHETTEGRLMRYKASLEHFIMQSGSLTQISLFNMSHNQCIVDDRVRGESLFIHLFQEAIGFF
uniref:Uncharacterized protein n=1 Tax=Opuntia streptacantha TaxID=393608 RepID=A0A7C9AFL2_OPUST